MLNLNPLPVQLASPAEPHLTPPADPGAATFEAVMCAAVPPKPSSPPNAPTAHGTGAGNAGDSAKSVDEPALSTDPEDSPGAAVVEVSDEDLPPAEVERPNPLLIAVVSPPPPRLEMSVQPADATGPQYSSAPIHVEEPPVAMTGGGSNEVAGGVPARIEAVPDREHSSREWMRPSLGQVSQERAGSSNAEGPSSRAQGASDLPRIVVGAAEVESSDKDSKPVPLSLAGSAPVGSGQTPKRAGPAEALQSGIPVEPRVEPGLDRTVAVAPSEPSAAAAASPRAEARERSPRVIRSSGMDGAKSAQRVVTTEHFIPARPGTEQTLPIAAAVFPGHPHDLTARSTSGADVQAEPPMQMPSSGLGAAPVGALFDSARRAEPWSSVATIERLQEQARESVLEFRRANGEAMRVVLRPDGQTEMELRLNMRNGQIDMEAQIRRGDLQMLGAHWGQLQQSLSVQGVRLGGLQESSSFLQAGTGQSWTGQQQEAPPERVFVQGHAERPIRSVEPASEPRGGGTRTILGVGRSWETWA